MNKRGTEGYDFLMRNLIYIVGAVLFFLILYGFVVSNDGGARKLEDFYAKEISLLIDAAEPGMNFTIDVSHATNIASKKGVPLEEIFFFDNVRNEVFVKITPEGGTGFSFFNDYDIVYSEIKEATLGKEGDKNALHFRVIKSQK